MVSFGTSIRLTPPARAKSHSPLRQALAGQWTATSDDEQAVSTATLGPCSPRKYESRPAADAVRRAGAEVGVDRLAAAGRPAVSQ